MRNQLFGLCGGVALASILATSGCGGGSDGGGGGGNTSSAGGSSVSSSQGAGSTSSAGGADKGGSSVTSGGAGGGGSSSVGGAGKGGASASGGNSSTAPKCSNGATCGGDLVGTWNVTASCLSLSGDMDISLSSLGCATVPATGSLSVTGSWTANANKKYADQTKTTGWVTFPLAKKCLTISSVPVSCTDAATIFKSLGWATSECTEEASGDCSCKNTAEQTGGIGIVNAWADKSGDYTVSGSDLSVDERVDYSYCVSGDKLTLTPKQTILPLTGTVELKKSGTPTGGSGGGTAGTGGKGGSTVVGGSISGGSSTSSASGGASGGTGGTSTVTGGKGGSGGATGGSVTPGSGSRPCDIYNAANNPCITAHSTIRALLASYNGPLYRVKRTSDGATKDIGLLSPGGIADSAAQDAFCTSACTITFVFDQSGHGHDLEAETSDSKVGGFKGETAASATAEKLTVGGKSVYSLYTKPSQAYWHDGSKTGMPLGKDPMGVYMVTSGKHFNGGCCYDYGDSETTRTYVQGPTIMALNFSNQTTWGTGAGAGPWIMLDMEDGLFSSGSGQKVNPDSPTQTAAYITAVARNNGTTEMAIRGGDATAGKLATYWKGKLPPGKNPMKLQGAVVLGSGGDCCLSNNNASQGTFYEGAMVTGYPSDATEDLVQENIVAVGYGK